MPDKIESVLQFPQTVRNPCFFSNLCRYHSPGCDHLTSEQQRDCTNWLPNLERLAGKYSVQCVCCRRALERRSGVWVKPDGDIVAGGVFCPDCRPKPSGVTASRSSPPER